MSKNREKKHSQHKHDREAHHQEVVEQEASASERVLVETPKGSSRLRFMLNLGLVIFLLLIFSITGPMMSALTGDESGGEDVFVSWRLPGAETRTMNIQEFYIEKRKLQWIEFLFPYLKVPADTKPENDEHVARFLVIEDLARQAGVSAAGTELSETILTLFGSPDTYRASVARLGRGVTLPMFEDVLQRGLAYRRYRILLESGVGEVDPEEVVVSWKEQNQEYDFQYVDLEAADFLEEAKTEIPDAEVLQDWFDALPSYQKNEFMTEPSWGAELVFFDVASEAVPDALLERFPLSEELELEQVAKDYYNTHHFVRFVRPEAEKVDDGAAEEEGDAGEGDAGEADAGEADAGEADAGEGDVGEADAGEADVGEADDGADSVEKFYTFEEVAEAARREAPVYRALLSWLKDVNERIAAEEVFDMQTEAISLGLSYERVDPRTGTAWGEGEEPWSGQFMSGRMRGVAEGGFSQGVTVEDGALVISRVGERLPATMPPFEEVRERVGEKWAEERSGEIARERLEAIREALAGETEDAGEGAEEGGDETPEEGGDETPEEGGDEGAEESGDEIPAEGSGEAPEVDVPPAVDAEAFRTAVAAAGFEVVDRGFGPRTPGIGYDYTGESPAARHLRSTLSLYDLEEGQVAEAQTSRDLKNAFLVRYGTKRDPSIDKMGPLDLNNQGGQMAQQVAQQFFGETYDDPAWVAEKFMLKFAEPPAPEEPAKPGEQ